MTPRPCPRFCVPHTRGGVGCALAARACALFDILFFGDRAVF